MHGASQAVLVEKNPPANAGNLRAVGWEDPLEKETAAHCSALTWRTPRTEAPAGLRPWTAEVDTTEVMNTQPVHWL